MSRGRKSELDESWLIQNFFDFERTVDLVCEYNAIHKTNFSSSTIAQYCRKTLHLQRGENKSLGFTKEQDNFIRNYGREYTTHELEELFVIQFGFRRNGKEIRRRCEYLGIKKSESAISRKCEEAANAQKHAIGEEKHNKSGYTLVKIKENGIGGEKYKLKQRIIYESHYGEIPDDSIITFLDGDKENFAISNLACIPKKYHLMINHHFKKSKNPIIKQTQIKWCEHKEALNNVK